MLALQVVCELRVWSEVAQVYETVQQFSVFESDVSYCTVNSPVAAEEWQVVVLRASDAAILEDMAPEMLAASLRIDSYTHPAFEPLLAVTASVDSIRAEFCFVRLDCCATARATGAQAGGPLDLVHWQAATPERQTAFVAEVGSLRLHSKHWGTGTLLAEANAVLQLDFVDAYDLALQPVLAPTRALVRLRVPVAGATSSTASRTSSNHQDTVGQRPSAQVPRVRPPASQVHVDVDALNVIVSAPCLHVATQLASNWQHVLAATPALCAMPASASHFATAVALVQGGAPCLANVLIANSCPLDLHLSQAGEAERLVLPALSGLEYAWRRRRSSGQAQLALAVGLGPDGQPAWSEPFALSKLGWQLVTCPASNTGAALRQLHVHVSQPRALLSIVTVHDSLVIHNRSVLFFLLGI